MIADPPRFDEQAQSFDARAGLPESACREIALAVLRAGSLAEGELLLELGAGTGEIGIELCRSGPGYLGLDVSGPMLERFAQRLLAEELEVRARSRLLVADANARWPVADRAVRAVFGSRSLHLLDSAHLLSELGRVAAPGKSVLLVGRVARSPDSIRSRMRSQMRHLVAQRGPVGQSGERGKDELISACVARGASALVERSVASWTVRESPARSLGSWNAKSGLAGVVLAEPEKQQILCKLRDWAEAHFGTLDTELDSREEYLLGGAVFDTGNQSSFKGT